MEVLNTDAEGRLVLADDRAGQRREADLLVDIAALTGAQLIALGSRTSAIMANDDAMRTHVHDAATRAGEQMWPMPLPDELAQESMDTELADIANMGERFGAMLVAGLFLREFVPTGGAGVHLDIAGPSFSEGDAYGYTPKGCTGAGVRTLVQLARDVADSSLSM